MFFHAQFVESFFHEWMLNFVQYFLCISCDDPIRAIFHSINVVNHINDLYNLDYSYKSHRQRNLIGYSPWGRKESDATEQLHFSVYNPGMHPT